MWKFCFLSWGQKDQIQSTPVLNLPTIPPPDHNHSQFDIISNVIQAKRLKQSKMDNLLKWDDFGYGMWRGTFSWLLYLFAFKILYCNLLNSCPQWKNSAFYLEGKHLKYNLPQIMKSTICRIRKKFYRKGRVFPFFFFFFHLMNNPWGH